MKDSNYYEKYIAHVPDFPQKGIIFRDITPTLENAEAFKNLINDLCELASKYTFNKIVCADARGFLVGAPMAYKLNKSLVVARKPGKLPRPGTKHDYALEYGMNTLMVSKGSFSKGDKVLVIDDLLATGGSACAMIEIVKKDGATPVAGLFYIELPDLKGREFLENKYNIPIESIAQFPGT